MSVCLWLAGLVPVTIRPPHPQNIATTLPTVKMIVEVSKAVAVLSTQLIVKMMKSKVCVPKNEMLSNLFTCAEVFNARTTIKIYVHV